MQNFTDVYSSSSDPMFMTTTIAALQVRQRLYKTSVSKWKQYEKQMQPAARLLHKLVARYEQKHAAFLTPGLDAVKGSDSDAAKDEL